MIGFTYKSLKRPTDYKCAKCGASGCKLWRWSSVFNVDLRCIACAASETHTTIHAVDGHGKHHDPMLGMIDQIGGYVPAVPVEGEEAYWGYTSVPEEGIAWWRLLPLFDEHNRQIS